MGRLITESVARTSLQVRTMRHIKAFISRPVTCFMPYLVLELFTIYASQRTLWARRTRFGAASTWASYFEAFEVNALKNDTRHVIVGFQQFLRLQLFPNDKACSVSLFRL